MTDAQRAVGQKFEDPVMRELVKDLCMERSLRHDVFVRGARRLDNAMRDAALMDVVIGLNIHPDDLPLEVDMPAGRAELNRAFYQPIAHAMGAGPMRIGDLLALPDIEGRRDNPAELLGMLVGLDLADPIIRPDAQPGVEALRYNRVATKRLAKSENIGQVVSVASHRTGAGVAASVLDLLVMDRLRDGEADMEALVRLIAPPPDQMDRLRDAIGHSLGRRMPIMRAAGVF
jgi:hypothetical protein